MNDQLQTQLFGPYLSSFLAHNYSYELSNEPKSVLKLLGFRFGPHSRTTSLCPLTLYGQVFAMFQRRDVSAVFFPVGHFKAEVVIENRDTQ